MEVKDAYNAINKFIYCGWNYSYTRYTSPSGKEIYVPRFIIMPEYHCSIDHMVKKWIDAIEDKDSDSYLTSFWKTLDNRNRFELVKWIMSNYDDEPGKAE